MWANGWHENQGVDDVEKVAQIFRKIVDVFHDRIASRLLELILE